MATERQIFIDNGENIDATWLDHIAISNDGVAWETISKDGLDVSARTINQNTGLASRHPGESKGTRVRISLNRKGDERPVLEFDVDNVANQAGWIAGSMAVNRLAAVTDITTWLASATAAMTGGATETTQLANQALLTDIELNTNEDATVLTSNSTTGSGTIPASSKAATVFIDGVGGSVNGVVRPNGWSQTFEFNNDLLPSIPYDGNGVATVYVDYLT